jgi:hypothetical protein
MGAWLLYIEVSQNYMRITYVEDLLFVSLQHHFFLPKRVEIKRCRHIDASPGYVGRREQITLISVVLSSKTDENVT